jgi:hypothetical protein
MPFWFYTEKEPDMTQAPVETMDAGPVPRLAEKKRPN